MLGYFVKDIKQLLLINGSKNRHVPAVFPNRLHKCNKIQYSSNKENESCPARHINYNDSNSKINLLAINIGSCQLRIEYCKKR